jgi:EpsI family protein
MGMPMARRIIIVSLLLVGGGIYLFSATRSESIPVRHSLTDFPAHIGNWEGEAPTAFDQKTLKVLGVDDYINRFYLDSNGGRLALYIGFYSIQREGDTIHSPLNCLPGSGWNPTKKESVAIAVRPANLSDTDAYMHNSTIKVNRLLVQNGMDKQVVLYWYHSHGRVVASEYWGKIYTVLDAIRMNRTDAALVRIVAPVMENNSAAEQKAEAEAVDFVKDMFPLLSQYLPD